MSCKLFSISLNRSILGTFVLLPFVFSSCQEKAQLKPTFKRVERHMMVSDTITLNTGQNTFLDMVKVRLNKSHVGLLDPLSASFTLYDLDGNILNSFRTNNTEKRASGNYIYGGVPVDFILGDASSISMLEINTSKIASYTLSGERIAYKELDDNGHKVSVPINLFLNTFLSTTEGFMFSTKGGMTLFNEKKEIEFDKESGILFSLNSTTGGLNKEMSISNVLDSPIGDRLTFFQLGVFKNKRYILFTNDPTIHVFDVNGKYLNSISLPIQELGFVKEISLSQQASNFGISYFDVTESGFRFYVKKPIENSKKYKTFVVDLAMDFSTYSVIDVPDDVKYVINNPQSDLVFYTSKGEGIVLYLAKIIGDL